MFQLFSHWFDYRMVYQQWSLDVQKVFVGSLNLIVNFYKYWSSFFQIALENNKEVFWRKHFNKKQQLVFIFLKRIENWMYEEERLFLKAHWGGEKKRKEETENFWQHMRRGYNRTKNWSVTRETGNKSHTQTYQKSEHHMMIIIHFSSRWKVKIQQKCT